MAKDIFLTNSLGGKKEKFTPKNEKSIGMYVCGPTVYDDPHIGNARPLVVFDILYKILKNRYGSTSVKYIRNITDIDDKICCLLYTSPSPRDPKISRMPSSA